MPKLSHKLSVFVNVDMGLYVVNAALFITTVFRAYQLLDLKETPDQIIRAAQEISRQFEAKALEKRTVPSGTAVQEIFEKGRTRTSSHLVRNEEQK